MDYFGSDFHFFHSNVIKYDKRPFYSVDEMNERIIKNCMELFKPGDRFFFVGDWALSRNIDDVERTFEVFKSSGVQMFFIKGNHDKKDTIKLYQKYGVYLGEQKKIDSIDGQEIVLNHYRMDVWDKSHHGVWHLHGHSHHSLPERPTARCIDVGINGKEYNYTPLSFIQVKKYMDKKDYKPIDHHGRH